MLLNFNVIIFTECKKQTLANLANFAYDPINYEFIKQLHLTDLFLSELSGDNEELIQFALAGICNLSCGKLFVGLYYDCQCIIMNW